MPGAGQGQPASQGTGIATQLSNDLLTEQHIQGAELPEVLKQVGLLGAVGAAADAAK